MADPEVNRVEAFHVSEYIDDALAHKGWTWEELARQSGAESDPTAGIAIGLLRIRNPRIILGPSTAGLLAKAFGTSPELWMNLDRSWREHPSVSGK